MFGEPGYCPLCLIQMRRRGTKDQCPKCHYLQPCCDGGYCEVDCDC